MLRMLLIGVLMVSVVSACSSSAPFTATLEPPATAAPLPKQPGGIEYPSVAEALADLKIRDDVSIEVLQGWIIAKEADGLTNWSFPPADHPAYPAVAKRVLFRDQDGWHLKMDVLCEAEPAACDEFVSYFEVINAPMYQYIEQHQ